MIALVISSRAGAVSDRRRHVLSDRAHRYSCLSSGVLQVAIAIERSPIAMPVQILIVLVHVAAVDQSLLTHFLQTHFPPFADQLPCSREVNR